MKTITIYTRNVIVVDDQKWQGYREYLIFESKEDAKKIEDINRHLLTKYYKILQTRSKKELEAFKNKLGKNQSKNWIEKEINRILEENK